MHVISRKPFIEAALNYPNQALSIETVYKTLKTGQFSCPDELRAVIPSLDNFKYMDRWWVIDIGGNHLRMIAFIEYRKGRIFVKHIVTHAEYTKLCRKYSKEKRQ